MVLIDVGGDVLIALRVEGGGYEQEKDLFVAADRENRVVGRVSIFDCIS